MKHLSVLSWNVQGKINFTGHTTFKRVEQYLQKLAPDIVALQEVCNAEILLTDKNFFQDYEVYIPEFNRRKHNQQPGFNNNVILSKYPLLDVHEIIFPFSEKRNLENCICVDVKIDNKVLRIYNCHFPIFRVGMATRLKQLNYILCDSLNHTGPIIICGDLNTTLPQAGWKRTLINLWHQQPKMGMIIKGQTIEIDEREIFNQAISKYGFKEVSNLYTPTWSPFKTHLWEFLELKLDWFIIKDVKLIDYKLGGYVSDHKAIMTKLSLE